MLNIRRVDHEASGYTLLTRHRAAPHARLRQNLQRRTARRISGGLGGGPGLPGPAGPDPSALGHAGLLRYSEEEQSVGGLGLDPRGTQ